MKIKNKDVIQSYVMTTAKYDFNADEKRVLYRIVEVLQAKTQGLKLKYDFSMQEDLFGKTEFTMPIKCFLPNPDSKNYDPIKEALVSLRQKGFEYEDSETWGFYGIIEMPVIKKRDSFVKFTVTPLLMKAFLNFSKGSRKYELETAMAFESVYAMRFYELLSGKTEPISYGIDKLKKMFGIEDKYKDRPGNFINKVIIPAQKELTKHAPYSFKFEKIKTGKKITGVNFKPYFIPKNRDPKLEERSLNKNVSVRWTLSKEEIFTLKEKFGFTDKGMKNNIELLKEAVSHEKFRDWVKDIHEMAIEFEVSNPTGFFIKQIRKNLEEI
jgi:plasmid replication initiation protein